MDARPRAVETDGELEAVDRERDEVRARPGPLHLHVLERLAGERGERVAHLDRAIGERAPARQPPVRLQRGLLTLRTVDAADAAARQAEVEQLLERLLLVLRQLAVL